MSNVLKIDDLFQRSRARVKGLGEVFTPEEYVEDMLKILSKDKRGLWADEGVVFFEPSCGHGNIVTAIYKKRLEAIYAKEVSHGAKEASLTAIANAIDTLWAIDVDAKNINECRYRVLFTSLEFFRQKTGATDHLSIIKRNLDFAAHLLCAIAWQIHENDTLSSLSDSKSSVANAAKTKVGQKWILQNGHKELNFEKTWSVYFEEQESKGVHPIEFERAIRFLKSLASGNARAVPSFEFANFLISHSRKGERALRQKDAAVGL